MFWILPIVFNAFHLVTVAAQSPTVVCIAGQCLQGYTNVTVGAILSADGAPAIIQLLPGRYTTTTSPLLLHDTLSFPSAELEGSAGFPSGAVTLPMDFELQPGLAVYSESLYSGQVAFATLPTSRVTNSSVALSANSMVISSNVWVALSSSNRRFILWDSVPDISELPFQGSLSLIDIQSSSCTTPCSSAGVCSSSGTCICPSNFNGSYCESCAEGFFGPTCQPCPEGCPKCDQGITGSGGCSTSTTNAPLKCDCINGVCADDGTCTCIFGWTTGDNGTACAGCLPGFYLTGNGDCETCQPGCTECDDGTGVCTSCVTGMIQNTTDATQCAIIKTENNCLPGSFFISGTCDLCAKPCGNCYGGSKDNCLLCDSGYYLSNSTCVKPSGNGICSDSNGMVVNSASGRCEPCGAKCTACKINNFSSRSTLADRQCTACLPGSFLYQNECVSSCPSGMFASSSQGNATCSRCSASCSTCQGSADFCLTCPAGQIAYSGKCISTCPPNSFSSAGSCISCHPDCLTCSGSSFNQCSSCPNSLFLTNGRCLPTCSRSQFFDTAGSTCQACDSSCSSCSGPGPTNCLACSSPNQVLLSGSCVPANCQGSKTVIAGLGVCLSDLVIVSSSSPSGTSSPLPSLSGLSSPVTSTSLQPEVKWWQILLMLFGGLFVATVILFYWRKCARKRREKKTRLFAREKLLDDAPHGWRGKLARFGQRLFGLRRDHDDHDSFMDCGRESLRSPTIPRIQNDMLSLGYHQDRTHNPQSPDLNTAYEHSNHSRQSSTSSRSSRNKYGNDMHKTRSNGQLRQASSPQHSLREPSRPLGKNLDTIDESALVPTHAIRPPQAMQPAVYENVGYPRGVMGHPMPAQSEPQQYPPVSSYGSASGLQLVGRYPSPVPTAPEQTFWVASAPSVPRHPHLQPRYMMSYREDPRLPSRAVTRYPQH